MEDLSIYFNMADVFGWWGVFINDFRHTMGPSLDFRHTVESFVRIRVLKRRTQYALGHFLACIWDIGVSIWNLLELLLVHA